jgi:uncharacterized protein (DUF1015 family)
MADVRPFHGIRFNTARFGRDVTDLVCPPYDVISPAEQAALYARHDANYVRLELTRGEPGDQPGDRYQRAGDQYRAWRREGILVEEPAPAIYAYLQSFTLDGAQHERRGLVAALRIEPWDRRIVRPHERTLSGPKQDRLNLMHACRVNFSPIWGLYRDRSGATGRIWRAVLGRAPDAEATDGDGVRHSLWAVAEIGVLRGFEAAVAEEPVYIADGHHRYETAMRYQTEMREQAERFDANNAANFVLAYLVESSDPGLFVLGTHRILSLPRPLDRDTLTSTLSRWFYVQEAPSQPAALLAALERARPGAAFGVWAPRLGVSALVRRADPDGVPADFADDHSGAWRRLDLAALHTLAIDQLVPEGTSALSESGRLRYARTLTEVEATVNEGQADVAFLVRHTPVTQVMAVADAGDLMPEKSTYFYPKPVSGLVLAGLEGEIAHIV